MIGVLITDHTHGRCPMHSTTLTLPLQLPADLPFAFSLQALVTHLQRVPDQRHARGTRYPLPPLLALAVVAQLAGHTRLEALADWAKLRAADLAQLFGLHRGTIPLAETQGVHLVAAYLPEQGVVLAQLAVDRKENEIVVVPTL